MFINNDTNNGNIFFLPNFLYKGKKNNIHNIKENITIDKNIDKITNPKKKTTLNNIIPENSNDINNIISSSSINVQTIIQIRNQLITAYQEIMNIQI